MEQKVFITKTASYFPNNPVENDEMVNYLGGGSGTRNAPYTFFEYMTMGWSFKTGWVQLSDGTVSYLTKNYSSYSGRTESDYNGTTNYWGNTWGGNSNWYQGTSTTPYDKKERATDLDDVGTFLNAIQKYAGKTQVGQNGKLYFETETGKVFYGNQYVATTSLKNLSKSLNKILGPVGFAITVCRVGRAYEDGGIAAAVCTAGQEAGGWAGAFLGGRIGSVIGTAVCGPGEGTLIGGVAGAIGGSWGGSYVIEITIDAIKSHFFADE